MKCWSLYLCILFMLLVGRASIAQAGGTANLTVSATIPSWGFCAFRNNSYTLDFGTLDASIPADASSQTDVQFRCLGWRNVTYYISHDNGLYSSGPGALRMKHQTRNSYLPYALSLSQNSGTIQTRFVSSWQTLQVNGTVLGSDYQSAYAGQYSDTVVLTIVP